MKVHTIICITLLTVLSCSLKAQQQFNVMFDKDGKAFIIPSSRKYTIEASEPLSSSCADYKSNPPPQPFIDGSNAQQSQLASLPSNINVLSSAYAPFFNPYTQMFARVSPFALDFNETNAVMIYDNLAAIIQGRKTTWPLLSGQTDISSSIVWRNNRLTVAGGVFAGNYYTPLNLSPALMGGISLDARYEMSDKFALRGWGQYAVHGANGANNPWIYNNAWMNHTGAGGAIEYMVNDNFGIGGGVEYRFNPMKGKLEPHPVVYPVFKHGSFSIGVR
jgi:hypothetical protein